MEETCFQEIMSSNLSTGYWMDKYVHIIKIVKMLMSVWKMLRHGVEPETSNSRFSRKSVGSLEAWDVHGHIVVVMLLWLLLLW